MKTFELKPGMICSTSPENLKTAIANNHIWVIFPNKNTKNGLSAIRYGNSMWSSDVDSENMTIAGLKIYTVLDSPSKYALTDGDVLLARREIKEMTVSEIEDKLNMQPGTLRVKQ